METDGDLFWGCGGGIPAIILEGPEQSKHPMHNNVYGK
jgi:hypothetical protein